ncbi:NAD(P)H-binding protein [Cryptosporangium phraense]|nr:NAD(P)H-binding protein [Cryptosporangium phraense]
MTILVTAGHGKTGRRIVSRLAARGLPTRVGSRGGTPPFDWYAPSTWPAALHGVDAAYLAFIPDLTVPGGRQAIEAVAAEAGRQGVRRLVLLSGRGEAEAERCEQVVAASGLEWTVLRCSWFAQNFSEDFLLGDVLGGTVRVPATDVREPFVDADDIADVAVAALTDARHAGQLYELTGPRAVTFAEATAEIAAATGRDLKFEPVGLDEYLDGLRAAGVPDEVSGLIGFLFREVLDGRNAVPQDGVRRALGREARDFAAYARDAAASGAWDA